VDDQARKGQVKAVEEKENIIEYLRTEVSQLLNRNKEISQ